MAPAFQIVEATDRRYPCGLQIRQTDGPPVGAGLSRPHRRLRQGPGRNINSILTVNPRALEDADRLDAALQDVRFRRARCTASRSWSRTRSTPPACRPPTAPSFSRTTGRRAMRTRSSILRKAGAIILGKTTLSEYSAGDTYGSMFGITRNPYNLERTVGGSSGGSGGCARREPRDGRHRRGDACIDPAARRPGTRWCALRPTPGLVSRSGMWDGHPSAGRADGADGAHRQGPRHSARRHGWLRPEDPSTALGVGQHPASYAKLLDANALKGARIGILREFIGIGTDTTSEDFKKVDAAFAKNIAELKAAGAVIVDPIVIPDVKKLIATRDAQSGGNRRGVCGSISRAIRTRPSRPTRTSVRSPDLDKSFPPFKADQWRKPPPPLNHCAVSRVPGSARATDVQRVQGDGRPQARRHRAQVGGTAADLIKDGTNPPYMSARGVPTLNTFLVYSASMTVPSGFTER